ncbi:MAG: PhzF family phenazine biosynthesis protein [Bacteroidota bacterium]
MKLKIYQVDAFTSQVFGGNPAAVCILDEWLDDAFMQSIANENNLSETAFAVPVEQRYEIRWFTPEMEVELCGHATLATAHVLFEQLGYPTHRVEFYSIHSGRLFVEKSGDLLTLDFPADTLEEMVVPEVIVTALRKAPLKAFKGKTDFMFIYASQSDIEEMEPDFGLLAQMGGRGVIVTAMGNEVDFVSRFFAPQTGINEDPVTGSAHTTLVPYWSRVLGKKKLTASQLSTRGGDLVCENMGERVRISGHAVTYMEGEIQV